MRENGSGKMLLLMFSMFLILSVVLTACTSSNNKSGSNAGKKETSENGKNSTIDDLADKQVLNLYETRDIPSMDVTQATDSTSIGALEKVKAGLMTTTGKETFPDMAASMPKKSHDGRVYTYKLRKDAKWSDGSPVTAKDFVFGWKREVDPDIAAKYGYILKSANVKNAAKIMDKGSKMYGKIDKLGIKAIDKHTLKVTLSKPTPYFNSFMYFPAFYPLKKEFVEKQGDKYGGEPENILYNGPFKMKKWDHGEGWTYVKNDKYYNANKVNIQKVNYKVVKDDGTALKLYKNGKIDEVKLNSDRVDEYQGSDELHKYVRNDRINYWKLNLKKVPAFKNKKVRKAIFLALDRKNGANVLLNNGSLPANYFIPKHFKKGPEGKYFHAAGSSADISNYPKENKKKAKKLWNEGKQELGITKLDVTFNTTDKDSADQRAEYFANQLKKTLKGFHVTIDKKPWKSYLQSDEKGDYDIAAGAGWSSDYKDPTSFLDLYITNNSENTGGYSNKKYDRMMKQVHKLGANPNKRWKIMQKAEKHLINNAVLIPTFQEGGAMLIKPNVKHFKLEPTFYYRYAKITKH